MKPFLLLSTRPEDDAAVGEAEAIVRFGGLDAADLEQIRVERAPLRPIRLDDYSGVILGGGPFNASDVDKTDLQLRIEADLGRVLDDVIGLDFPFLGLCYGIGTVTSHLGGLVDQTHGEPVGATSITLTKAGQLDPLLVDVPERFTAFVGHKEAVSRLPEKATLLATGESCPVQMFRVGQRCYVTQFHPELDRGGISERIRIYKHAGYFAPEETDSLTATTGRATITPEVHRIVRRFVERFAAN